MCVCVEFCSHLLIIIDLHIVVHHFGRFEALEVSSSVYSGQVLVAGTVEGGGREADQGQRNG